MAYLAQRRDRSTYATGFLTPPEVATMHKLLDPLLDVEVRSWGGYEQVGLRQGSGRVRGISACLHGVCCHREKRHGKPLLSIALTLFDTGDIALCREVQRTRGTVVRYTRAIGSISSHTLLQASS